jgi:pyruvate/2-oxoglutarate dehydrogenase complex dihydrolipoamide acyltransferase (E2) component
MRKPVLMPDVGAPSAVVSAWFVQPGERVYAGDRLVELLVGGATVDVSAAAPGVFVERTASTDSHVTAGQVLGYIEEE